MLNIGVFGCGWLGLPLAESLLKKGFKVKGTTTSIEKLGVLKEKGIDGFEISVTKKGILGDINAFLDTLNVLIINIPPRLRKSPEENYTAKIQLLLQKVENSRCTKIIFISSTAIYGDVNGTITEETQPLPTTASGRQILEAEKLFTRSKKIQTTIIRFGGLIGPNRHPITILSGKKNLKNGDAPVNLIHLTDCIAIIENCISKNWWNETFNAVYPLHPTKRDYYIKKATINNLEPPTYNSFPTSICKKIKSFKLIEEKGYIFKTTILS